MNSTQNPSATITCTTCTQTGSVLNPDWHFVTGVYEGAEFCVALCGHCYSKISEAATGNILSAIKAEMRLRGRAA